ncbi:iron-sulfur cluster-binding protein [Ammonifex degensii KC4]|uniref:Iron-sulfur cluster-binding protein n=1 Tax=Ammonifex degensii (strain DSM 10501 / KC4) TaxID=429009 RepID=C9R9K5_AMMDK|nr:4Fe-4S binding protein [Ammonifex degensii]ACX52984.1 iron-sulfur cluster-binding protein [Ammonifex degensii KC4]
MSNDTIRVGKAQGSYLLCARNIFRVLFGFYLLYLGWRFYLFVRYFETGGAMPLVDRPPAVEGFLPIGALMALRYWLATGLYDPIHPAALSIFLVVLLVSLLFKKGFCSWICPVGTISEGLDWLGVKLFRQKRPVMPRWLDLPLRSLKYGLLAFFVLSIFSLMSVEDIGVFLHSPYYCISDVKMLQFFLHLSPTASVTLLVLAVLSIIYRHFWCHYLCPYGALLGIISIFSPLKITRNADLCSSCRTCDRVCPAYLKVSHSERLWSPECNACLRCVESCPSRGALTIAGPGGRGRISPWVFGGVLLAVFFGLILLAQVCGYWQTVLTPNDYSALIPYSRYLTHPGIK